MSTNLLLASLPTAIAERLTERGQRLTIPRHCVLCEEGEPFESAYFPLSGLVSLQLMTEDGNTLEIAAVGREGIVGLPILLPKAVAPYGAHMLVSGDVLRVPTAVMRTAMNDSTAVAVTLLEELYALAQRTAAIAVCHRFHSTRQRLCRWLLSVHDRAGGGVLALTQEAIGACLGVPRTAVTTIAVELQDLHAIQCRHGRITIMRRPVLEQIACSCQIGPGAGACRDRRNRASGC